MKAILCVFLLAAAAYGAEEKKNEKRGVLGVGYGGLGYGGLGYGGLGYGGLGYGGLGYSGLAHGYGGLAHGYGGVGHGLGLYGGPGLYGGHLGAPISHAPLISHSVAAPLGIGHVGYGGPLLGLGHGWH